MSCHSNIPKYTPLVLTPNDLLNSSAIRARGLISIDSLAIRIRSGDLITRTGNDFTSESLRQLNQRDKTYSHCGIASIENDSIFVYHSIGGDFNPDQKIRKDPIRVFADPQNNRGMGLYRFQLTPADHSSLMNTIHNFYNCGVRFDEKFDLQSDDRMYCAEFVYKSLLIASKGTLRFHISHINNFSFIGVDDLFLQPLSKGISQIIYK